MLLTVTKLLSCTYWYYRTSLYKLSVRTWLLVWILWFTCVWVLFFFRGEGRWIVLGVLL